MLAGVGAALLAALPGWIVTIIGGLLGKEFGSKAAPDAAALAQAQKDRADNSDAMLKAKVQGDAIDDSVRASAVAGKLRDADKFEVKL